MLGSALRRERETRNISLSQLSHMTGLNQSTLNRIEMGHTSPRYVTIDKITRALGLELVIVQRRDTHEN